LEHNQYQARQGTRQTETNATDRLKSLRGAYREQVRRLFVRTTKHQIEPAVRKVAQDEQSSFELFRKSAAVLSKNDRLVDCQREERRNATGSPGEINQRVCERKTPASITKRLLTRDLTLLDREADISPSAPFVMRSALHISAASLFFVRVRFGDEFRERCVHLDIV
jgi:hypothetical protein